MISFSRGVKSVFSGLALLLVLVLPGQARTVAFFYALDADWRGFQEGSQTKAVARESGGRTIFEATVGDTKVYAVKMEAGCVQTAISAQALLTHRRVDLAFSVGPVGSLDESLEVGTWAVVERVVPYQKTDLATSTPDTAPEVVLLSPDHVPDELAELVPISVASGERFIKSSGLRGDIAAATGCNAVDMNLFGLLSALEVHKVPSVNIRVASDYADESASEDFARFVRGYDGRGGKMVAAAISALPPDMTSPAQYPELQKLLERSVETSQPHQP